MINTVRGPVDPTTLGVTLAHEHVFVLTPDSQQQWGSHVGEWDEQTRVADAVEKLQALVDSGVQTILDPTVDGLGRDVPRVIGINAQVPDLNILVATGIYTYVDVPNFFAHRSPMSPDAPDPMVELFVKDIEHGIQGTEVKAAFLKCAIDHQGLTPGVERVLRACANAQLQTGVPLMVHTHPGSKSGREVQRVLAEIGVPPTSVLLAHSGDTTDADHLQELAEAGFLLGMDRFGIDVILDPESRIGIVAEMCARGFANSMVLAQDASCYLDWLPPDLMPLQPNWHYLYVQKDVVPALLDRGVSQDQVDAMLIGNPRRFFEQAA